MGVHTGFVERLGGRLRVDLEVHRAARVGAAAAGGQVLVTAATRALLRDDTEVEDLGEHRLKDFPRPERLFNVVYDGRRAGDFGPLRTAEARPTNLPEDLAPLLGRDGELAQLESLLSNGSRLVTLVGAGGAGKTRLALAAARRLLDDLPGGAFVVALAPVGDPGEVLPAVARALDLGDDAGEIAPRIAERLGDRRSLLVLDNFEQILAAGPSVAGLLERSPRRCGCSSPARRRCTCAARRWWRSTRSGRATPPMLCSPSGRGRRRPAGAPGPGDAAAIAEVCERVGRLPLAVELAAARVAGPAALGPARAPSGRVLRRPAQPGA